MHNDSKSKPKLSKVPQEDHSSSMTTTQKPISILWRPNNYRRQIEVKTKSNSGIKKIKTTIPSTTIAEHTKIVSIKGYTQNITIQYGKNTLTAIYSQNRIGGVKEIFLIEAPTLDDIDKRIAEKKKEIQDKLDKALNMFSKRFKLAIPLRLPVWSRYEDFIKGEEYIDKIPREVIIHDTYFKKVYGKGIEFIKAKDEEPTVHLKNYIKNRAVEEISPLISDSINKIGNDFDNFNKKVLPCIEELSINMKTHVSIMKGIDQGIKTLGKTMNKLNNRLDQTKLNNWM